ncbi:MAG TPA: HAMP domain-containing sensor histidine kinase [Hyalangium sp.]|nr:HAMP domain-containing sensor histidine kinase [Hyalangium sp.]
MSLRRLLGCVTGGGLLLALTVAAALMAITTRMNQNTQRIVLAVESVRAAEEIEIALLVHNRERRLLALTGEESHAAAMRDALEQLQDWLHKAENFVGSSEERAIILKLTEDTQEYLAQVEQLRAQGDEHLEEGPHLVDRAYESAERLIEFNVAEAHGVAEETRRWNRLADMVGILVSTTLFAGISVALWSIRRFVYRPLVAIRDTLVRFRLGTPGLVAPEAGALELREISREFNEMATRLERQREVQLHFIASVAHDLRNPLSALKLTGEVVRPDRPLPPEEKVRERFVLVTRQVERITRMVEDLLDTARIEAGRLELRMEEQDLRGLLRDAVALHEGISPGHELVLHVPEAPVQVRCDATRISQVLNNLLSNAIKYSPQGGQVRVGLTTTPHAAWVAVKDQGAGIAASERESIFEPFRRSAATRDTIPGVGLGLAVSRRIIEAHGGHIEVESVQGAGSTFRFCLPRL